MRITYILLIGLILITFSQAPEADAWYDEDWSNRKEIEVDSAKVENDNFNGFPLLISITDTDLQNNIGFDNGQDILFVDNDDLTQLEHEIENYDNSTGTLVAWVRIPTLYDNENTIIYMYYGNDSAGNQENVAGVWDDNYKAVWHMIDNTPTTILDSTSVGANGTKRSSTEPVQATGKIWNGQTFDGANDDIDCGTSDPVPNSTITISVWYYHTGVSGDEAIVAKQDTYNAADMRFRLHRDSPGDDIKLQSPVRSTTFTDENFRSNVWTHMTVVNDATSGRLYVNGVLVSTDGTPAIFGTDATAKLWIGTHNGSANFFTGTLDEIRMSNNARSANYIYTMFNNENDPATFYSIGSEENAPVIGVWKVVDNWTGTVITSVAPTTTVPEGPARANLSTVIRIIDNLTAGTLIENVVATISIDNEFMILTTYPENRGMDNFTTGQTKTAEWLLATPLIAASYDYNVTWDYDDIVLGAQSIISATSTIDVAYPDNVVQYGSPGLIGVPSGDGEMIAMIAVGIAVIACVSSLVGVENWRKR